MSVNRRIPEASALRAFFQEQWETLQQLLDARQEERLRIQQEQETLNDAVESIVEGTETRLRLASGYQRRLRGSARGLLEHIETLIDALPAAIELSQKAFVRDPWVNALFRNPHGMHQLFSGNSQVQAFFDEPAHQQSSEVFALLFVNRTEKRILGSEMRGDIIVSGVEQTAVSFTGHSLRAPRASEEQARYAVKELLFESVIQFLRQRMTRLKYESREDGKIGAQAALTNPDLYLERLLEQMHLPQSLIRLQDDQLRINSMGIKIPPDAPGRASEIALQELGVGDRPARVVTLVRYPRAELQEAPTLESLRIL